MAKYLVTLIYSAARCVEIEADNEEDAIERAYDDSYVSLCHQCSMEIELGDLYSHEVEKLE